jgi:hypothetical protein
MVESSPLAICGMIAARIKQPSKTRLPPPVCRNTKLTFAHPKICFPIRDLSQVRVVFLGKKGNILSKAIFCLLDRNQQGIQTNSWLHRSLDLTSTIRPARMASALPPMDKLKPIGNVRNELRR